MRVKGIKQKLKKARGKTERRIYAFAKKGFYEAGMASEGYAGGYRDALDDVLLALNGADNCNSRFWPREEKQK